MSQTKIANPELSLIYEWPDGFRISVAQWYVSGH